MGFVSVLLAFLHLLVGADEGFSLVSGLILYLQTDRVDILHKVLGLIEGNLALLNLLGMEVNFSLDAQGILIQ